MSYTTYEQIEKLNIIDIENIINHISDTSFNEAIMEYITPQIRKTIDMCKNSIVKFSFRNLGSSYRTEIVKSLRKILEIVTYEYLKYMYDTSEYLYDYSEISESLYGKIYNFVYQDIDYMKLLGITFDSYNNDFKQLKQFFASFIYKQRLIIHNDMMQNHKDYPFSKMSLYDGLSVSRNTVRERFYKEIEGIFLFSPLLKNKNTANIYNKWISKYSKEFNILIYEKIYACYPHYKSYKYKDIKFDIANSHVHILVRLSDEPLAKIPKNWIIRKNIVSFKKMTKESIFNFIEKYQNHTIRTILLEFINRVYDIDCSDVSKYIDNFVPIFKNKLSTYKIDVDEDMSNSYVLSSCIYENQEMIFYEIIGKSSYHSIFTAEPKIKYTKYSSEKISHIQPKIFDKIIIEIHVISNNDTVLDYVSKNRVIIDHILKTKILESTEYSNYMKLYKLTLSQGTIIAEFCFKIESECVE